MKCCESIHGLTPCFNTGSIILSAKQFYTVIKLACKLNFAWRWRALVKRSCYNALETVQGGTITLEMYPAHCHCRWLFMSPCRPLLPHIIVCNNHPVIATPHWVATPLSPWFQLGWISARVLLVKYMTQEMTHAATSPFISPAENWCGVGESCN